MTSYSDLIARIGKAIADLTGYSAGLGNLLGSMTLSTATQEYQDEIAKRIDYYKGEAQTHFETYVDAHYPKKALRESMKQNYRAYNITEIVIDGVSVVYAEAPERKLVKPDGSPVDDKETALYEWLVKDIQLDCWMQTVNSYVSLCDTVLVRPFWYKGKLRLEMITPDMFTPIEDPQCRTEALAMVYHVDYVDNLGQNIQISYVWTEEAVAVIQATGAQQVNEYSDNPYGILPFARFVHEMPTLEYLAPHGSELIDQQEALNIELAQLAYLVRMQSFSVPVLIGYEPNKNEQIAVSPGDPVVIGPSSNDMNPGSFHFETPSPEIEGSLNKIRTTINMILYKYGLQNTQFSEQTGGEASGIALRIKNERLLERRKKELPFYIAGEQDLFEIIKKVWNTHAHEATNEYANVLFSDDTRLDIQIPEPETITDPVDDRENWQWLFDNSLSTPVDYLAQTHKISVEDAQAIYDANQKWRDENGTNEIPVETATGNFDEKTMTEEPTNEEPA